MFDFIKTAEWIARAFSSFFRFESVRTEHQAETDIIKSKEKLEKSKDTTKKIIYDCLGLLFKYRSRMTQKDLRKLLKIIKKTKELI